MCVCIKMKDRLRTGCLVPGRDAPGLWPDGRVVGTSPSPPSLGNWGLKQFFLAFPHSPEGKRKGIRKGVFPQEQTGSA